MPQPVTTWSSKETLLEESRRVRDTGSPVLLRLAVVLMLMGLLRPNFTWGGTYTLMRGHEHEVCQAYAQNLERSASLPWPMACERQYHPEIPGLSTPKWRKLDIAKYAKLWGNIARWRPDGYARGESPADVERYGQEAEASARARKPIVSLYMTMVDLTQDGKPEKVLAVRSLGCGPYGLQREGDTLPKEVQADYAARGFAVPPAQATAQYDTRLYVVNQAGTDLDDALQKRTFGTASRYSHNLFLYQGHPYVDMFEPGVFHLYFGRGDLYVFDAAAALGVDPPVCTFEYFPTKKRTE
jgi:hypothetical protein